MITKKEISETLALSCVESYFLAWLKNFYDVSRLYGSSFVSIKQVFEDFANGASYENYNYIPRMQDVAEKYGVVKHKFIKCSAKEALEILKKQLEGELCLIRVNSNFYEGYKRVSWRDDHYVCVNESLEWVNHYPLTEGSFDEHKFEKVYDGIVCIYSIENVLLGGEDFVREELRNQRFVIKILPSDLGKLEAAIGVLRISRKRLEKYYETDLVIRQILQEEIFCLDKLYFDIHLYRVQKLEKQKFNKTKTYSKFYEKLQNIIEFEKKISEMLNNA